MRCFLGDPGLVYLPSTISTHIPPHFLPMSNSISWPLEAEIGARRPGS